jgi:RNA polymerase sigma-70 factor (ECF subfamily)
MDNSMPDVAELYRLHSATVARWATRLGGPDVDADDVVQDVFLVARRRLPDFQGDGAITTWLYRTTERIVFAARRKARMRRLIARFPFDLAPFVSKPAPLPMEALERADLVSVIHRLLDRLPEQHRKVLILFEIEGLATDEIATMTGTCLATVRVWLHRARTRFAVLFAKEELKDRLAEGPLSRLRQSLPPTRALPKTSS